MDNKIKELKDLLWEFDNKHSVSVPDTHENINNVTERIVKLFAISDVSVAKRTVCVRNNRECLHLKDNIWCLQNHFDCEFKQTEH